MKTFETDGELYNYSLTRKTYGEASKLKDRIERYIRKNGSINIMRIVCGFNHLPDPKNLTYALSRGWTEEDIPNFKVRKHEDGTFGVYVGTPRLLNERLYYKTRKVISIERQGNN